MPENNKKRLKWGFLLFLLTIVVTPIQMLYLLDYQVDQEYWCSDEHFSAARCEAAEGAVFTTLWSVVIFGLVMLVSIGMLLDLIILPQHEQAEAS